MNKIILGIAAWFLWSVPGPGQGFTVSLSRAGNVLFERVRPSAGDTLPNLYGVKVVSRITDYRKQVAEDPSQELVALDEFIPGIVLDIRYATENNFMEEPMYRTAAAYLRLPAARALRSVQEELRQMGYGLKIFDGYRPYSVTVDFYEKVGDSTFVASPWTGSRHNRGCAVDLTIVDLKTGKQLPMPTGYDVFTEEAHTDYPDLTPEKIKNRELLKKVMTKYGFDIYPDEWWHYDFAQWKKYPLMDIPFEAL